MNWQTENRVPTKRVEGFVKDLNELANREQGTNKKGIPNIDVKDIKD